MLDLSCGTQNLCCHMQALSCGVWDLVPWSGIEPGPLYWQCSLNHDCQEVPSLEERRRDIRILALQSKAPCESQSPDPLQLKEFTAYHYGNKQRSQDHIWGISLWSLRDVVLGPPGEPWWLTLRD